jgi:hypothetical protein
MATATIEPTKTFAFSHQSNARVRQIFAKEVMSHHCLPAVKGAGAVYSRAISKCVSDADLSTGKLPAYLVVRNQRHSEKGAVSPGFPAFMP